MAPNTRNSSNPQNQESPSMEELVRSIHEQQLSMSEHIMAHQQQMADHNKKFEEQQQMFSKMMQQITALEVRQAKQPIHPHLSDEHLIGSCDGVPEFVMRRD